MSKPKEFELYRSYPRPEDIYNLDQQGVYRDIYRDGWWDSDFGLCTLSISEKGKSWKENKLGSHL